VLSEDAPSSSSSSRDSLPQVTQVMAVPGVECAIWELMGTGTERDAGPGARPRRLAGYAGGGPPPRPPTASAVMGAPTRSDPFFGWVTRIGVEERFLYRGDGDGFLVHGEKRGGHRESAGDVFIPIRLFFFCY
jgi:hypothetical protein